MIVCRWNLVFYVGVCQLNMKCNGKLLACVKWFFFGIPKVWQDTTTLLFLNQGDLLNETL